MRNFISKVSVCPSVPSSPFTTFSLYSLNPGGGGSRARQNCGQVPRWLGASHSKAGKSLHWAQARSGSDGNSRGGSAIPRGAEDRTRSAQPCRLAPRPRDSPGPRRNRDPRGPRGAAFAPKTALDGELYLTLGRCWALRSRREMSVWQDMSAACWGLGGW